VHRDSAADALLPTRAVSRKAAFEKVCDSTFADQLDSVQGLARALLECRLWALALIDDRLASWPDDAGTHRRML
jgi:type VI secretion system protein VasJ